MSQRIYVVSDATGETAEKLVASVLIQFEQKDVQVIKVCDINTVIKAEDFCNSITANALVCSTLIDTDIRDVFDRHSRAGDCKHVDLIGAVLQNVGQLLDDAPAGLPGRQYASIGKDPRVEAMEFTMRHDDGMGFASLHQADAVLVAPSRCGKTPVSMYLATKGLRMANVPFVVDVEFAHDLQSLPKNRVFGLVMEPAILRDVRLARLEKLGSRIKGNYTELAHIEREMAAIKELCAQHGWSMIDITHKAVEESAAEIESALVAAKAAGV